MASFQNSSANKNGSSTKIQENLKYSRFVIRTSHNDLFLARTRSLITGKRNKIPHYIEY